MRLRKLDLLAYGRFTTQPIEFPAVLPDFHFIVGPNEAGKSTARDAIVDLLFGIGGQSPYNFLHPYATMRLAAVIEQGGERIEFHRTKRNRQPIRDAADNPLPDTLLGPFLGGADRAFFERMFALDHRRLDQGGTEILQAKDDVGRMLFESAAGLTGFGQFRDELEQEADQLFSKRHSAIRTFYQVKDRLEQADRALREVTLRPSDWNERQATHHSAQNALEQATEEVQRLAVERTRLERVRRVASDLRTVGDARQERDSLKNATLLPADAAQVLNQAERAIALATYERQRLEANIATITERLRVTPIDERVLAFKDDIIRLTESRNYIHKHEADIQKQEAIVAGRYKGLEENARQLGWPAHDLEALHGRLPNVTSRAEIRALIEHRGALVTAVDLAQKTLEAKQREIEDDERDLQGVPEAVIPADLRAALNSARAVAEAANELPELVRKIDLAERRLTQALTALKPWSGNVAALRALPVLDADAIRDFRDRALAIEEKRRTNKASARELREELTEYESKAARIEKEQHPVTREALERARNERDSLWARIRDGEVVPKAAGGKYERTVRQADELADRRYAGASAASTLETVNEEIARTRKKIQLREDSLRQLDTDSETLHGEEAKAMTALGLRGMKTNVYLGWLERRQVALHAAEQSEEAQSHHTALTSRVEQAHKRLRSTIGAIGPEAKEAAQLALPELVQRVDEFIGKADGAIIKRQQLVEALRKARAAQPRLRGDLKTATDAQARWTESWRSNLSTAGLEPTLSVHAASVALELIGQIEAALREIRQIKVDRIGAMRRDLDEFDRRACEFAEGLVPEASGRPSQEISRQLEERLRTAELVARDRIRDQTSLKDATASVAKANEQHQAGEATLAPLLRQSCTQTIEELRHAIERSEKCRQLDAQIATSEKSIAERGDGLPTAELEKEVAHEELTTIGARLVTQQTDLASATERRDTRIREVTAAQQALDQCSGQQHAADAEAQRQESLTELAEVVKRYVKVQTAARLLRWGIDQYSERKQGPLLAAAADYFRALTCGSLEGLVVDFDRQPPALLGRRPDGKLVPVGGMSDGTRDPLYLALRFAAVDLHLASGKALPFIADDLFMSLDDERARAGFEALAALGTKMQVIYLSHHAHLVPIARRVFGDGMSLTQLPR